jgi:NAD(P)-dependent dehydrogenase (short-subunit alcohol dehydrogenase family)
MTTRFDGQVAIVTGAGSGLGRCHALGLAAYGAKVVVSDLGVRNGSALIASPAAEAVASEIVAAGGDAVAEACDVADLEQVNAIVERTKARWGRIDILVNNAGILRDRTFGKMPLEDFDLIVKVHLRGTVNCTKAVWDTMRAQNYGRIVFTSSSSGIFGNFGQANYGAAKAAMVGLMNVLHLEGIKHDIRVNTLAPAATTRMTRDLLSPEVADALPPEAVTPGVLYLVSRDAPSKMILGAGAGVFAVTHIIESQGIYFPEALRTPDEIARRIDEISEVRTAARVERAGAQSRKFIAIASEYAGN